MRSRRCCTNLVFVVVLCLHVARTLRPESGKRFCAIIFVFEMWPLDFLCASQFVLHNCHLILWTIFEMDSLVVENVENICDKKKPLNSWRHIFSRTLTDSSFGKSRTSVLLTYLVVMMKMMTIKSSEASFVLQLYYCTHHLLVNNFRQEIQLTFSRH